MDSGLLVLQFHTGAGTPHTAGQVMSVKISWSCPFTTFKITTWRFVNAETRETTATTAENVTSAQAITALQNAGFTISNAVRGALNNPPCLGS